MLKSNAVVGLLGSMGSGKDTLASYFVNYGYEKYAIADNLKKAVQKLTRAKYQDLWGPSQLRTDKMRKLLQSMGDLIREYDENILINRMIQDVSELRKYRPTIITDVRLPQEVAAIKKELNGIIVKIEHATSKDRFGSDHSTETYAELASYPDVDYVIGNFGDLEDLYLMQEILSDELARR